MSAFEAVAAKIMRGFCVLFVRTTDSAFCGTDIFSENNSQIEPSLCFARHARGKLLSGDEGEPRTYKNFVFEGIGKVISLFESSNIAFGDFESKKYFMRPKFDDFGNH